MRFETDADRKAHRLRWIIETCFDSLKTRRDLYERRSRFYLFGTATDETVRYNRLLSHMDLVSSFLYSPEHATYNIAAARNSDDVEIKRAMALQDEWNDDFRDWGIADLYGELLDWALVFDTMLLKFGWNDVRDDGFAIPVAPDSFGVFNESIPGLDNQQAFAHRIYIDYDNAVQRLERAGLREKIPRLVVTNTPFVSPYPELLTRMIITATSGENLGGNLMGAVNPLFDAKPTYAAKVDQPLVEFFEVTAWDDDASDWRTFHVCDPDIVISDTAETVSVLLKEGKFGPKKKLNGEGDSVAQPFFETTTNIFLPKEHPFVVLQPHGKFNYFWGRAHIDPLIPLQEWSNERLEQIADILEKQAYPPRIGAGFMGLTDEKMEAFGGADSWIYDQLPNAQIKELAATMPDDIFAEFMAIGQIFQEASGLTDVIAGQGSPGVRSRGHAKELKKSGSGRITKLAVGLEKSLVRCGDLGVKLKMKNDDEPIRPDPGEDGAPGAPFYAAQVDAARLKMRIQGHSHSPLFHDDTQALAFSLFKAQAVDQENLIRLLNPPNRDNLIHALRARLARLARQRALAPPAPAGGKGKQSKEAQHGTA